MGNTMLWLLHVWLTPQLQTYNHFIRRHLFSSTSSYIYHNHTTGNIGLVTGSFQQQLPEMQQKHLPQSFMAVYIFKHFKSDMSGLYTKSKKALRTSVNLCFLVQTKYTCPPPTPENYKHAKLQRQLITSNGGSYNIQQDVCNKLWHVLDV